MPRPLAPIPADPAALPPRIHLPHVLELAGYGRATLWRRQRQNVMPQAIDRGPYGGIFDRDAVLKALGIVQGDTPQPDAGDAWSIDPETFRRAGEEEAARRRLKRRKPPSA